MDNAYALIMAGGVGSRLWPLSRREYPKPLINLVEEERSMFQIAVERITPLFSPERVLVIANSELAAKLAEQTPQLPEENFIIEPQGRDTAPAVGLGAVHVRERNPDGVMAVLTADHYIADEETFRGVLGAAVRVAAQDDAVVTLGIEPGYPSTGFGYIERGAETQKLDDIFVYELRQFREKPSRGKAREYVASGQYSWNSGMFIWRVERLMAEFKRHAPDLSARLEQIAASIDSARYNEVLDETWDDMQRISIDYALMEHLDKNVRVIPVEMGWNDIGNFGALYDVLSTEEDENIIHSRQTPVLFDTEGSLIVSDKMVTTIGLEDVIVIDTEDALLICRRDRAQDVKEVVNRLKKEQRDNYL